MFQERIDLQNDTPNGPAKWIELLNTIILAEESGKTRLTLDVRVLGASAGPFVPCGMDVGWAECLDRLESFVTKP